ncbi:MAG: B12-binding domain-containing radical SAM protein [Candidatus Omnitrophica bacterium]|nr:B12-binding domain-containing radical SAM protein [Candidatus Omnitrophota bacterium]
MANVLLISPSDQFTLGVRTLSAVLKRAGHRCRIVILYTVHHNRDKKNLDVKSGYRGENSACSDTEYDLLCEAIRDFDTDVIGLSLASQSFGLCAWLTEKLHRDFPKTPVMWGGVDPTLHPELGIEHADYLARGEAEDSLLELLQLLGEGKDASKLEGFWVRRGSQVFQNPMRPLIQDLDRLPWPDYDKEEKFLIEADQIQPIDKLWYIILTQRGCPYRCTFCINSTLPNLSPNEKYVRRRSPQNTIGELKWIKSHYPDELNFVWFWDDIFTISKKWLKEFAPLYRDEIGIPFCCYTYPGQCDDTIAECLNLMGVEFVHFGVESGSKETLNEVYGRKDPAGVVETAQVLHRHGIPYRVDLIAANPWETDDDHRQTLEILLQCPHPFRVNPTNPLAFYFNLPITKRAQAEGIPLRPVPGANAYLAVDDNHFHFWKNIFDLAQYPHLDPDFIRHLARDPYFIEHPEFVIRFQEALQKDYWAEANGFTSKQDEIESLRGEIARLRSKLEQIEGSPFYRAYRRAKELIPVRNGGSQLAQAVSS